MAEKFDALQLDELNDMTVEVHEENAIPASMKGKSFAELLEFLWNRDCTKEAA